MSLPTFTKEEALALAARCVNAPSKQPREAGQRALLACHYRRLGRFARDEDAWTHFGSSRQRFYEWQPSVVAIDLAAQPAPAAQPTLPVAEWRIAPRPPGPPPIQHPLRVAPSWMMREVPSIQSVEVGDVTLTPAGRHSTRTLSATVLSPGGSEYHREADVLYSNPRGDESALEVFRRGERQRRREETALRELDYGGVAADEHRHRRAERAQSHREANALMRDIDELREDGVAMQHLFGPEPDCSWRDPEVHVTRVIVDSRAQTPTYLPVSVWLDEQILAVEHNHVLETLGNEIGQVAWAHYHSL